MTHESFFEAQRKHRLRARLFEVLCAAAVFLLSIPLGMLVTPVLFLFLLIVSRLASIVLPEAKSMFIFLLSLPPHLAPIGSIVDASVRVPAWSVLSAFLMLWLPGVALMIPLWFSVRKLTGRAASLSCLQSMGTRPPNDADFKEHQVKNLVEEMSISAGVPVPPIGVVDTSSINAGAVGTYYGDAAVVVTNGLIEALDREELEAVMAHVTANIVDEDLRPNTLLVSLLQTVAALSALLKAPISVRSCSLVMRLAGIAISDINHARRPDDCVMLFNALIQKVGPDDSEGHNEEFERKASSALEDLAKAPYLGIMFAAMSVRLVLLFCFMLFIGPALAMFWRARRYLADAVSVQLTRDPNALSRALEKMDAARTPLPCDELFSPFFVVWPKEKAAKKSASPVVYTVFFHPSVERRVKRLKRLGANVPIPDARAEVRWTGREIAVSLLLFVLALIGGYLMLTIMALCIMLNTVLLALSILFIPPGIIAGMLLRIGNRADGG